ncbi:MAG: protein kinase, partial [bacterium]|nr:protein kinase [bacterium]
MGSGRQDRLNFERYLLLGEIGRGAMGSVHRARDRFLERYNAIKVLHGKLRDEEGLVRRFVEEAQIGGQLDHPNIVPVHLLDEDEQGTMFFSMKLVEGETLEQALERAGEHRLAPERLGEFLGIFLKVCEAVAFAHSRGVIHRDLKPSNIMVGEFGQVYLMDWGIAHRRDKQGDAAEPAAAPRGVADLRKTANVIGTPAYMAPEQAGGRHDLIDERSDVFLLGATLYHILTGQPPYPGGTPLQQLIQAQDCEIAAPETVTGEGRLPPPLVRIVKKAMTRNPDARYPSVSQLQRDVELFLHGSWYQRTETFAPGSKIVSEGEDGDAAYIIVEGRCAAVRERGSKKVVLRELGPGDVFGETAVFSAARRTATVEALDEVTVTVVTRETLAAGVG